MLGPLRYILRRIIRTGDVSFVCHDGTSERFGDGSGRHIVAKFADRRVEWQLVLDPQLAIGEAYMQGRLRLIDGNIYDLLLTITRDLRSVPVPLWAQCLERLRKATRYIAQYNPASRSKRNVAHHYDIDGSIYDLFLDPDRQYSCAYFDQPGDTLEEAQLNKKRHLAAKLQIDDGHKVLDIGCGWGGLGLYIAKMTGAKVTGITLSENQLEIAKQRARAQGLSNAVSFELTDYRDIEGPFDRIVSVGMFEHVGLTHYGQYFRQVHDLLTDDGVAVIHTIGQLDPPTATNAFISKYIFPGGYFPSLSEMLPSIEKSHLYLCDVEVLRLHYAETLKEWRRRFMANRAKAVELRGEEFARMWEFYLAGSEVAFRNQDVVVFQVQLTKQIDTLPLTRNYMLDEERRLASLEQGELANEQLAGE